MNDELAPPRRPQISLLEMLGLVALAAMAFSGTFLIVPAAVLFVYGALRKLSPARKKLGWIVAAFHLPCVLGFFTDCPHCRNIWEKIWSIMPGAIPWFWTNHMLGLPRGSDALEFAAAGVATLGLIALAIWLAGRGAKFLFAPAAVVAGLSTAATLLILGAMRM